MRRRRRYQKGSLQLRKREGRRAWVVLYYLPNGKRDLHLLGFASEMTKGDAQTAAANWMRENVNTERNRAQPRPQTMNEFLEEVYLPFQRGKWKPSTRMTTEQRLNQHIVGDLGGMLLSDLDMTKLQRFLDTKADEYSKSIVTHLRFDLQSIFRMALAKGMVAADPTPSLYTPRRARQKDTTRMNRAQVLEALEVLPQREQLMLSLAILSGIRPGEFQAIQRRHVAADGTRIEIKQRVYAGQIDDPKTNTSRRTVMVGPKTAALLAAWLRDAVEGVPEAYVFASEAGTPLWTGNIMQRIIRSALRKVGLEWFNFQVSRRTHGSLTHGAKVDPKVAADQRGHGIGVSLDVYTRSSLDDGATAAQQVEESVLANVVPFLNGD